MRTVTLLFLRRDGELLLAMKKRGFGKDKWNGVGGKQEPGETPLQAAIRECQEEICVTPRDPRLVGRLRFYLADDPGFLHDAHIFIADTWEGAPQETEEMRPQWFAFHNIPYHVMWPDDIVWVPHMLAGKLFTGDVIVKQYPGGDRLIHHSIQPVATLGGTAETSAGDSLAGLTNIVWQHLAARDWDNPSQRSLAISLSLEANELLEHYQWQETPVGDKQALAEELADILIYALQYAHVLGVDLAAIIRDKLAKSARKYPAGQFKGKSAADKSAAWLKAKATHRKHKKGL